MSNFKVLHSSFACDPAMGSEPYVGWNWAKMMCDDYRLHVITREYHRGSIEESDLSKKVVFHYFDLPSCATLEHRSKLMKSYYVLWQFLVFFKVLFLHYRERFDLVHHVTYNNLDVPGFLWLLPGAKFVWGPVGGGQVPEVQYKRVYSGRWKKETIRGWLKRFAKYNPIVLLALRKSSLVFFANEDTKKCFNSRSIKYSYSMLETAVAEKHINYTSHSCFKNNILNILWVGQLEPRKALRIVIDSIAYGKSYYDDSFRVRLDVVGGGEEFEGMLQYVKKKGLENIITLHGKVAFHEVSSFYEKTNLFVFSSVQDTSGNVVLEAMSTGIPVVALNHQGVKEILSEGGGVLVDIGTYEETVAGIAKVFMSFICGELSLEALGQEATEVIREKFTWEAKAKEAQLLYDEILS